jgi:phasin family protein
LTRPLREVIVHRNIAFAHAARVAAARNFAAMAETDQTQFEASAEKAHAAAAETVGGHVANTAPQSTGSAGSAAPVEFPAKPKRAKAAIEAAAPTSLPRETAARAKIAKPVRAAAKPAVKRAPAKPAAAAPHTACFAQLKEIPMDMTASLKDAYAKTTAAAGEYGEFAKGNVEALVESGKILASGLQGLGNTFVADSKTAFETLSAEAKELASVKSPADFFKLQTELLRRNFDSAIAYGSKTSEAMLKLTNDALAPISGRVSLAVEKVKKAA